LRHDELQPAVDLGRAEEGDFFGMSRLCAKVFDVLDDHVAGIVERRGFELLAVLDLNDLNVDAVVLLGHRLDAIDDRRAVVVAVSKPNGPHE